MPGANGTSHSSTGEIIMFDDFTTAVIDRTKWNVRLTGPVFNQEQQAYIDSTDTIYIDQQSSEGNGILVIHPRHRPAFRTEDGKQFDFISGRMDSREKVEFRYGNVSARIKLLTATGVWPAFWMNGSDSWPACGEIDIMENVGEEGWVNSALHGPGYSGDACLVERYFFPAGEHPAMWHVYSMEWTPDHICFKVDEHEFFSVDRFAEGSPGPWVFDNQKHLILNVALGGKYPFDVNGIRFPYLGLPDGTIHAIRRDEIKMLVDWVKVTSL